MIKFAGLLDAFDSLVDTIEMEMMTRKIPKDSGTERTAAII